MNPIDGPNRETPSDSALEPGAPLQPEDRLGRYRILAKLSESSAGEIYQAWDVELERHVAIKLLRLPESREKRDELKARLQREAQAMAKLSHPNVVTVYELAEVDGRFFVAMEWVEGGTLRGWLRERPRTLDELLEIFLAAGRGLSAALRAGIVHRAFTIDSVLVSSTGKALVTDFGLAAEPLAGKGADARDELSAWCNAFAESLETLKLPGPPRWLRRELDRGMREDPLASHASRHTSIDALLDSLERGRERSRSRPRWPWFAAAAALALIAAATWAGVHRRSAKRPLVARTIAVLSPRNAAPQADSDWLAPVLAELIASDLDGDPSLHPVSGAEVAAATNDLELRGSSPTATDVPRWRSRLSTDLVLGGKYTLADGGKLTCELVLWEPQGEATLFSEEGDTAHLAGLGARLGADVRRALGLKAANRPGAESSPANLEVARLYAEGLEHLHDWESVHAIASLEKAAALAPENPRIQVALLEAYLSLRDDAHARKPAERAFELRGSLGPDEQTRVEILYRRATHDNAGAIALARARYFADPSDLTRGLDLVNELNSASRWTEIRSLVAELRRLPAPAGDDARIDLSEANACFRASDFKCAIAAAERAYATAKQRGARSQMARARYTGGDATRALGDLDKALLLLEESAKLHSEGGDRSGAAGSRTIIATIFADRGDLVRAHSELAATLAIFEQLGDRASQAATLHNLAVLMRKARDLPAALKYAKQASAISLELGQMPQAANSLRTLGNILLDEGNLDGAEENLTRSIEILRKLKSPRLASTLLTLCSIKLLQGKLAEVHQLIEEARAADGGQDKAVAAYLSGTAAELALEEERNGDAAAEAERSAALFQATGFPDQQAIGEAFDTIALLQLGRVADARAAIDRAQALLGENTSQLARASVTIAAARVLFAEDPKNIDLALKSLREFESQTVQTGAEIEDWQARFAIAELELQAGKPGAHARLTALANKAHARGFGRYENDAASYFRQK